MLLKGNEISRPDNFKYMQDVLVFTEEIGLVKNHIYSRYCYSWYDLAHKFQKTFKKILLQ